MAKKPLTKNLHLYPGLVHLGGSYARKVNAYTDAGLEALRPLIEEAQARIDEISPTIEDIGSCVLGAGVQVYYIAPRCRKVTTQIIATGGPQGNVGISRACAPAIEFLRANGVECRYYDGVMD